LESDGLHIRSLAETATESVRDEPADGEKWIDAESVIVSDDEQVAAVVFRDERLALYNLNVESRGAPTHLRDDPSHTRGPQIVRCKGRRFAQQAWDGRVRTWSTATDLAEIQAFAFGMGSSDHGTVLEFSPDGKLIFASDVDDCLYCFPLEGATLVQRAKNVVTRTLRVDERKQHFLE